MENAIITKGHFESPDVIKLDERIEIPDTDLEIIIRPVRKNKAKRKPGSLKGLIHMRDDFNDPLDDFKDYM